MFPSTPFQFLDLPPEIRSKIYTQIVLSSLPILQISHSPSLQSPHPTYPHSLLQTCSQIYQEIRPFYFTQNNFAGIISRNSDDWETFLSDTFMDNRRQINNLKIYVERWGPKNFFVNYLVPALKDCVLNGRLRRLKIIVKKGDLRSLKSRAEGEQGKRWRVLKGLLLDPYLEKAILVEGNLKDMMDGDQAWENKIGNEGNLEVLAKC